MEHACVRTRFRSPAGCFDAALRCIPHRSALFLRMALLPRRADSSVHGRPRRRSRSAQCIWMKVPKVPIEYMQAPSRRAKAVATSPLLSSSVSATGCSGPRSLPRREPRLWPPLGAAWRCAALRGDPGARNHRDEVGDVVLLTWKQRCHDRRVAFSWVLHRRSRGLAPCGGCCRAELLRAGHVPVNR